MLKPSALSIRRSRKLMWIKFLLTGVSRRVLFHATSDEEANEIPYLVRQRKLRCSQYSPQTVSPSAAQAKQPGQLRLSLVGRVHVIKNVLYVLKLLEKIPFRCSIKSSGRQRTPTILRNARKSSCVCLKMFLVEFCGSMTNEQTVRIVEDSDAMILPTRGENFGHAIFESLAVGVPVVISDQTYWRQLEADGAGWDLPLDQPERFRCSRNLGKWELRSIRLCSRTPIAEPYASSSRMI